MFCNRNKLISVRTKFVHRARAASTINLRCIFYCRPSHFRVFAPHDLCNSSVRRINRRFSIRFFPFFFLFFECRNVSNWALPTQIFTRHVMCAQLTIRNQTAKWEFSVCSIKKMKIDEWTGKWAKNHLIVLWCDHTRAPWSNDAWTRVSRLVTATVLCAALCAIELNSFRSVNKYAFVVPEQINLWRTKFMRIEAA